MSPVLWLNLLEMDGFNHKVEVIRGVLQEECSIMLSDFFREASGKEENAEKIIWQSRLENQKISGMIKNKSKKYIKSSEMPQGERIMI